MANHYERSLDALDHASRLRQQVSGELSLPDPDRGEVTRLSNRVRAQVKLAEVHALLAIAQGLADLRSER